jgi:hypothetical protein
MSGEAWGNFGYDLSEMLCHPQLDEIVGWFDERASDVAFDICMICDLHGILVMYYSDAYSFIEDLHSGLCPVLKEANKWLSGDSSEEEYLSKLEAWRAVRRTVDHPIIDWYRSSFMRMILETLVPVIQQGLDQKAKQILSPESVS